MITKLELNIPVLKEDKKDVSVAKAAMRYSNDVLILAIPVITKKGTESETYLSVTTVNMKTQNVITTKTIVEVVDNTIEYTPSVAYDKASDQFVWVTDRIRIYNPTTSLDSYGAKEDGYLITINQNNRSDGERAKLIVTDIAGSLLIEMVSSKGRISVKDDAGLGKFLNGLSLLQRGLTNVQMNNIENILIKDNIRHIFHCAVTGDIYYVKDAETTSASLVRIPLAFNNFIPVIGGFVGIKQNSKSVMFFTHITNNAIFDAGSGNVGSLNKQRKIRESCDGIEGLTEDVTGRNGTIFIFNAPDKTFVAATYNAHVNYLESVFRPMGTLSTNLSLVIDAGVEGIFELIL